MQKSFGVRVEHLEPLDSRFWKDSWQLAAAVAGIAILGVMVATFLYACVQMPGSVQPVAVGPGTKLITPPPAKSEPDWKYAMLVAEHERVLKSRAIIPNRVSAETIHGVKRKEFLQRRKDLAARCWKPFTGKLTPDRTYQYGFQIDGGGSGLKAHHTITSGDQIPSPSDITAEQCGVEDGDEVSVTYYVLAVSPFGGGDVDPCRCIACREQDWGVCRLPGMKWPTAQWVELPDPEGTVVVCDRRSALFRLLKLWVAGEFGRHKSACAAGVPDAGAGGGCCAAKNERPTLAHATRTCGAIPCDCESCPIDGCLCDTTCKLTPTGCSCDPCQCLDGRRGLCAISPPLPGEGVGELIEELPAPSPMGAESPRCTSPSCGERAPSPPKCKVDRHCRPRVRLFRRRN